MAHTHYSLKKLQLVFKMPAPLNNCMTILFNKNYFETKRKPKISLLSTSLPRLDVMLVTEK